MHYKFFQHLWFLSIGGADSSAFHFFLALHSPIWSRLCKRFRQLCCSFYFKIQFLCMMHVRYVFFTIFASSSSAAMSSFDAVGIKSLPLYTCTLHCSNVAYTSACLLFPYWTFSLHMHTIAHSSCMAVECICLRVMASSNFDGNIKRRMHQSISFFSSLSLSISRLF